MLILQTQAILIARIQILTKGFNHPIFTIWPKAQKFSLFIINIYFFFTINKRKKWVFGHNTPQTRIKPRFFAGQKHFQKWAETHFFWPFDQNSPKSTSKICIKNDQNPQKVGNWPKIFIKVGGDF